MSPRTLHFGTRVTRKTSLPGSLCIKGLPLHPLLVKKLENEVFTSGSAIGSEHSTPLRRVVRLGPGPSSFVLRYGTLAGRSFAQLTRRL